MRIVAFFVVREEEGGGVKTLELKCAKPGAQALFYACKIKGGGQNIKKTRGIVFKLLNGKDQRSYQEAQNMEKGVKKSLKSGQNG